MSTVDLAKTFGCHLFDDRVMREKLPANIYNSMRAIRDEGHIWDPNVADVVAEAMKNWAMGLGATHYIHWFSPMTGMNAGKHESFIDGVFEGKPILHFSGKMLMRGEPDASSFPSGGLRATFEARGYTAWDPTSPAFVLGTTLYIPTAFAAHTGEALDQKTPVLRSMQAVNKQSLRLLRALGDHETVSVRPSVGAEQEYFIVDKKYHDQRQDLKMCGYTLFGAKPPKGQEMDDHYYGSINDRVRAFMRELDEELWNLGVPAKTEHNETAPGQYELAAVYSTVNVACDHNQLIMELMRKVAARHGLACLLHEKPFAGVNGSGKHNNWSLVTNTGRNLLDPGEDPAENKLFLLFLTAVLSAVDNYADLIRLGATCSGNDFRLGAAEAPPAIISVFLGEALCDVLDKVATGEKKDRGESRQLLTGVKTLPLLDLDDNDRNRTSPFAFTGNKFEFRMVGASQSIGLANAIINAAVADTLREFADQLEPFADAAPDQREQAVDRLISEHYQAHRRIIFNGNNYTREWVEEAARRGLPNLSCMVMAVPAFVKKENMEMFARTKVFTPAECKSRYEIMMENYVNTQSIAASTMLEMVSRQILPAAMRYLGEVAGTSQKIAASQMECRTVINIAQGLASQIDKVADAAQALHNKFFAEGSKAKIEQKAISFYSMANEEMPALRCAVDQLETMVSADHWPMPTYSQLLFDL